jgi:hypothetical protein
VGEEKEESGAAVAAIVIGIVVVIVGVLVGVGFYQQRGHSMKELADYDTTKGEKLRLSTKGMHGSFEKFDVIENVPFAEDLAKTWANDAQLARIRVDKVHRGGVVDISGGDKDEKYNEVRYEFAAQGAGGKQHGSESHTSEIGSGSSSDTHVSLRLSFSDDELIAKGGSESPPTTPPPMGCTSMEALNKAIAPSNLQTYGLDLRFRSKRWVWEASGTDGNSVRVCADTCALEGTPECPKSR